MKKIAIILLCFCLLPFCSLTAFAENSTESDSSNSAVISVIVPESHSLEVSAPDGISVYLDGEENDKFDIPRLSETTFEIRSKNGEIISKVILNGDDITDKLVNGQYKLPPFYENLFLTVETKQPIHPITRIIMGKVVYYQTKTPQTIHTLITKQLQVTAQKQAIIGI